MAAEIDYFSTIEELIVVGKLKNPVFKDKFRNLVNFTANKLEEGPALKEIGFTPHDFKHHIYDIYVFLGRMLPEEFYANDTGDENLFILLTGALFHDLGMTKEWSEENRRKHSLVGKEMFLEYFKPDQKETIVKRNIETKYSDYIGDIIYAHSDIKNPDGTIIETFREVCAKYEEMKKNYEIEGTYGKINVPFLAALVRLADEFDITSERIENIDYNKIKNLPSSLSHFRLCEFFDSVLKGPDKITIKVNKGNCKLNILESEDASEEEVLEMATNAAGILDRFKKIREEFRMLDSLVLGNTSHCSNDIWRFHRVEIDFEKELEMAAKKKRIIIKEDGDFLTEFIKKRKLFESGHYRLDNRHSVRDWINLDGLFKEQTAVNRIIQNKQLLDIIDSKKTIIGINHYGAILAALLGYKCRKPFAYIFDSNKTVDALEREISGIEKDGIVLIIDVVVYGESLCKVLDAMQEKEIIDEGSNLDVIILFERIPQKRPRSGIYDLSKIYSSRLIHQVYVINDAFNIEICKKNWEDCIFREENRDDNCLIERNV
jgi:orotate phosphoribosyltransferase